MPRVEPMRVTQTFFIQQLSGLDRQPIGTDNYNFLTSDTDDAWDISYRVLLGLDQVIAKSNGSPHYTGVAKILKAIVLGTLAENFGSIPYRTALKANEDGSGLQPSYDSGPQNYEDILALLDQGIAEVSATESLLSPTDNEDIYGGDMSKWANFAKGLKARYYLHTAKKVDADYDKALSFATESGDPQALFKFAGLSVGSQGPLFQYQDQRGDLGSGKLLTDTLDFYGDPRKAVYVSGDVGSEPGQADGDAVPNTIPDESIFLMNSSEMCFIRAEVNFRRNNLDAAATELNSCILASLTERGISTDTTGASADSTKIPLRNFLNKATGNTAANVTLDKIMTQKYLALYLHPEVFADWRRTGYPEIYLPKDNVTNGQFVRKFPYPQKERTLNAGNVPQEPTPPQIGRVWWDQ